MNGPQALLDAEEHWVTDLGAFFADQGRVVLRGHDLHDGLDGMSWMDLLMFGITGRRFTPAQLELFAGLWKIGVSYPEPRIWNNRVAALGGSVRSSPGLSVGAALATSDATIYGQRPMVRVFDLFQRARQALETGATLEAFILGELRRHRVVPGYGRPLRSLDERLAPAERLARRLGLWGGTFTVLATDIAQVLVKRRMGMNVSALAAALYADQGLSVQEYHRATLLSFTAGMVHCELDAARHPAGALFPLRCSRIEYQGPAPRQWATSAGKGDRRT